MTITIRIPKSTIGLNVEKMNTEDLGFGKREAEVVRLLMQGKSNAQIAYELGISVRTVEYHLGKVYAKLGVASRTEAILKLSKAGLHLD